jgi:ABC-type branched-subunit amino acid transport system substrate-binding protein
MKHRLGLTSYGLAAAVTCATVLVLVLAGCSSSGGSGSGGGGSSGGTIKIGVDATLSGREAQSGQEVLNAVNAAVSSVNASGGVLGKKLAVVSKDNGSGSNSVDIQNFRSFSSSGIHYVFTQPANSSAGCLALGPVAKQVNILYTSQCSDPSLLAAKGPKNHYMAANIVVSDGTGLASELPKEFPTVKCWSIYSLDYITGHSVAQNFIDQIKAAEPDATIAAQAFQPLDATDVRPYINKLESAEPVGSNCGLFVYAYISYGVNFIKQATLQGLFSHYKVFGWDGGNDDTLNAVGSKTPKFYEVSEFYPGAYKNAVLTQATAAYKKVSGGKPFPWNAYAPYNGVMMFAAAMKKAGSTDVDKVRAALNGLTFQSVKGPITVRGNYLVQNASYFTCEGDKSSSTGWTCGGSKILSADETTPPKYKSYIG